MADYISNYTGQEIDDAVGKASNLPSFIAADANKVLAVNSTGNGLKYTTPASGGGVDLSQISTGQVRESSYVLTLDDDTLTWSSIIPSWGCGEVDCVLTIAEDDAGGLAWTSRYPSYNTWGSDDHKVLALDYNTPDWAVAPVLFSNECASKIGQIPKLKQTIIHGYNKDTYEYSFEWVNPDALPSYTSDDTNKVLTVFQANGEVDVGWIDINDLDINFLPVWDSDDEGKALQVIASDGYYLARWSKNGLVPPSNISGMGLVIEENSSIDVVDPTYYIPMWLSKAWAGENTDNVNSFLAVVPSGPDSTSLTWMEGQIVPLATESDLGKVLKVVSHTDSYDNTSYMPSWETLSTPASIPSTVGCGEYFVLRDGSDDSFFLEESTNFILDRLGGINSVSFSNDSRYWLVLYTDDSGAATIQWEYDPSYVPPQV